MPKNKKFKQKLPNELIHIPNVSKKSHEKWYKGRNIANFPRPYRLINCGSVNSSKTNTAKNVILRAYPRFDDIYLVHISPTDAEWDDIGITEKLDHIPDESFFDPDGKTLIIIEDMEFKENDYNLSALFRYISTHKNVSVILNYQSFIHIPRIARRLANVYNLWEDPDKASQAMVEKRVGLDKGELQHMFDTLKKHRRDFITIDKTDNSPAPMRFNLFSPIRKQLVPE